MTELDLLLKILNGLDATTPTVLGVIAMIKQGRAVGRTDEDIEAESMQFALETRSLTEQDMGDTP